MFGKFVRCLVYFHPLPAVIFVGKDVKNFKMERLFSTKQNSSTSRLLSDIQHFLVNFIARIITVRTSKLYILAKSYLRTEIIFRLFNYSLTLREAVYVKT